MRECALLLLSHFTPVQQLRDAHFYTERADQFHSLPKGRLNYTGRWKLGLVGEAAQSPTGSDLCPKRHALVFALSLSCCVLIGASSPQWGWIRCHPSIHHTHPTVHGNIILLPCHLREKSRVSSGHQRKMSSRVWMCVDGLINFTVCTENLSTCS